VRRQWAWVGIATGVVVIAGSSYLLVRPQPAANVGAWPASSAVPTTVVPSTGIDRPAVSRPVSASVARRVPVDPAAVPVSVSIARLKVTASVVPVDVSVDGELSVPTDPRVLGWWSTSARPGEPSGRVVIDGHVDSRTRGLGALFELRTLVPGDTVAVRSQSGRLVNYRVVARREYAKAMLPARQIFQLSGAPQLVLITCGGAFDTRTRQYADNVVVFAEPVTRGAS
jgi:hypothetical protein